MDDINEAFLAAEGAAIGEFAHEGPIGHRQMHALLADGAVGEVN